MFIELEYILNITPYEILYGVATGNSDPIVGLLLGILTSSMNILVLYLLVLLAIYLQIDIYLRFIYNLILFLNWI